MASFFEHIPTSFPWQVGGVSGIAGVRGGIGAFAFPFVA